jgi:hypothetical protein
MNQPTPDHPHYTKTEHEHRIGATQLWFITCNEGWRSSIVCERMYQHDADWLLAILNGQPNGHPYPFAKRESVQQLDQAEPIGADAEPGELGPVFDDQEHEL